MPTIYSDPNFEGLIVAHSYKVTTITVILAEHDVRLDDVMLIPLKPGEKDEDIPF